MLIIDPKIYLAINNCFAIKKWTEPEEWLDFIKGLGLNYVEYVTDLDTEPLLMDRDYLKDHVGRVRSMLNKKGMGISTTYSGNSTYDTTGLAHPDPRVRDHIINVWFARFLEMSAELQAPAGYYVQAFSERVLLNEALYHQAYSEALESYARINRMASRMGVPHTALEQMYTPNQTPFTIDGAIEVMRKTLLNSGAPLYITEDVGHHCPFYLKPTAETIQKAFDRFMKDGYIEIWLGGSEPRRYLLSCAQKGFLSAADVDNILRSAEREPWLFSSPRDNSCYEWLRELGCYSPSVHLQQTDGTYSAHKFFTDDNAGIIRPPLVLSALKECYDKPQEPGLPERTDKIFLTLELYAKTMDISYQLAYNLRKSAEYWRRYIPEDGMRLSELVSAIERETV